MLTQAEFAAVLGVTPPLVSKWRKAGRLVMGAAEDGSSRVRVRESITRLDATRDPARGGRRGTAPQAAPSAHPSLSTGAHPDAALRAGVAATSASGGEQPRGMVYQDQAAREKKASAQLRELELAEKAGQVVLAAEVERRVFGLARAAREALMSVPDRVAAVIAAESDPAVVHAKLTEECRRVCEMLATPGAAPTEQALAA